MFEKKDCIVTQSPVLKLEMYCIEELLLFLKHHSFCWKKCWFLVKEITVAF